MQNVKPLADKNSSCVEPASKSLYNYEDEDLEAFFDSPVPQNLSPVTDLSAGLFEENNICTIQEQAPSEKLISLKGFRSQEVSTVFLNADSQDQSNHLSLTQLRNFISGIS